jgi:hypothetical protein
MRTVIRTCIVIGVAACGVSFATAPAFAENPLYCDRQAEINKGCQGPTGDMRLNESRNENGGCIAGQMWVSGSGYTTPVELCSGAVVVEELDFRAESFNKCWNRTNAFDEIHCRYATY